MAGIHYHHSLQEGSEFNPQYIYQDSKILGYSLALVHLIPSWLVWTEMECTVNVVLTKRPIDQFKLVQ